MMNMIRFLLGLSLVASLGDPNTDLVLANSGMNLGVDNSLDRRILSDIANYGNTVGSDPELERNARNMKRHLNLYRASKNPTVEEWINIKNLAVSAVRGDCSSTDKLFEIHVIPREEYDKLIKRCGRTGINQKIEGHLQLMRAQEKAGDTMAHKDMNHLRDHEVVRELKQKNGEVYFPGDFANQMHTGEALGHGIRNMDTGKGVHDSIFADPLIQRDAKNYLNKDYEPLRNRLEQIGTPFARETADRMDRTRKIAEDVVQGVPGAAEKFLEAQASNNRFKERALGREGMDDAIRDALTFTKEVDDPVLRRLGPHEVPQDRRIPIPPRPIGVPRVGRTESFAESVFNEDIRKGLPEEEARLNSDMAKMAADEYESNLARGMGRPASFDAAIASTARISGKAVPEKVMRALEGYASESAVDAYTPGPLEREALKDTENALLKKADALEYAADKAKDASLAEEQMRLMDRLGQIEREKLALTPDQRRELDKILDKKKQYETSLAMDQDKKLKQPASLKDLTEIKNEFDDIRERNKRIVADERRERADAMQDYAGQSMRHRPLELINSDSVHSDEKKEAKLAEEQLAKQAEDGEVMEAGSIAAQNVKRLGGSDAEAAAEAGRAERMKRKAIEDGKAKRISRIKGVLSPQIGEAKAMGEAEHIATAHAGRNPTGNTLGDIGSHMDATVAGESEKKAQKYTPAEEQFGIVKLLPDNITQINADGTVVELPLAGLPSAKAETAEEEKIKEEMEDLRDNIRNKVTKEKFNSGLVTIEGEEGFLNLPESCKEIQIKNGTVYFDQAGHDRMVSQGLDTNPLKAVFSRGRQPLYYKADIKNMKMKLPSVFNSNPQKLLFNEYESINIEFAKKIEIVNGIVGCEAWDRFSARMRPKVYKGVSKGADEVPESIKKEFERIESIKDGMKDAKVNVVSNPDGSVIAEIKPQYGISSKMSLGEAVDKAAAMSVKKPLAGMSENYVNVEQDEKIDYTRDFMDKVEKDLKTRQGREEVLNETNTLSGQTSGFIRGLKGSTESNASLIKKHKREGSDQETAVFNKIVDWSGGIAQGMKMRQDDFLESLSRIDHATMSGLLKHYRDASSGADFQEKFSETSQADFMSRVREAFPGKSSAEIMQMFSETFSDIFNGPGGSSTSKLPSYVEKCSMECYDPVLKRCRKDCMGRISAVMRSKVTRLIPNQRPVSNNGKSTQRIVTPENVIISQPSAPAPSPVRNTAPVQRVGPQSAAIPRLMTTNVPIQTHVEQIAPLEICKAGQTIGCILQGQTPTVPSQKQAIPIMVQLPTRRQAPIVFNLNQV